MLVSRALCESRMEAQELISAGAVLVDGVVCLKQSKDVKDTAEIAVTKRREFVSRGGEKLQGALLHIFHNTDNVRQFCLNKSVLDIGSSTGGFSDCLLAYGVATVDAVDVGANQLHHRLRDNNRITLYENTDIRNFSSSKKYSIIVADVSFISLSSIFDSIVHFCSKGATIFLLIKPQFEVGKGNTKKGIVKNEELTQSILKKYQDSAFQNGFGEVEVFKSSIQGGDGNQEYFLYGVKQ